MAFKSSNWLRDHKTTSKLFVIALAATGCYALLLTLSAINQSPTASQPHDSSSIQLANLPASLVRVDPVDSSGQVQIVLSLNVDDLQDLADATGLVGGGRVPPRKIRYPEEVDIIIHNPNICKDAGDLLWIVYIHSSPANFDRRLMVRRSWGNTTLFQKLHFRVVFFIGVDEDSSLQSDILTEFQKYGDIVQGNFPDSYKNMTIKAVMAIRWISEHCSNVTFGLKADDDTFLNIFEMARIMEANAAKKDLVICPRWGENSMPILRDPKTCMKWCVPKHEFRGMKYFPPYCAGIGYAMSLPLIGELYHASKHVPYFWIDDVYVTGVVMQKLSRNVHYINLLERFTANENLALAQYSDISQDITYYFVHAKERENFFKYWNFLTNRLSPEQLDLVSDAVKSTWTKIEIKKIALPSPAT